MSQKKIGRFLPSRNASAAYVLDCGSDDDSNLRFSGCESAFYPEDGGDRFLENVGNHLQQYTVP
jgi:hypothetical protein